MKKQRSIIWFILCIFLQNVIYGFGNPLAKIGNSDMGTFWCPAARFLVASAVMLIFFGRRILVQLRAAGWKKWLPPSICLMCNFILFNLAIMFSSVTTTAFLNSMAVFFAPVMSSVFLGRRYRIATIPIQLAAAVGLFLLCCNGNAFTFGIGEVFALLSAVAAAGALVFAQGSSGEMDPVATSGAQIFVTAAAFTLLAIFFDDIHTLTTANAVSWLVVLYLGIACSCVAYMLQNAALGRLSAGSVSMIQCLQPIMTAFFSFLLLKEHLTAAGLAGAAIITAAVLLNSILDARADRKSAAAAQ